MRKIAHLITGLGVGGAEQMLLEILPRIQDEDLQNTVYCIVGHGPIGDALQKNGVPVVYLNYQRFYNLPLVLFRLFKYLKKERPEILVTYLIHADLFGRIIGRVAGVKKIICYKHGALLQWEFLKHADRLTQGLVTLYLTVSDTLKNKLLHELKIPEKKIMVIRNGIDLEKYRIEKNTMQDSDLRKEFGFNASDFIIGIIANLRRGKGHSELIHAFNAITKNSSLKLLIVGDGEEKESLKTLVKTLNLEKDIIFAGFRRDIPQILQMIDIFTLPSYFEGMSIAILEAMVSHKPIIATSIPENLEILTHNETALLISPGDVNALQGAILQFIEQKSLRERLSEQAYQECFKKYDLTKTISAFKNVLQEL